MAVPNTRKLAMASLTAALSVVLLYVASVAPTMRLALTALAGVLPAAAVVEGGLRWGAMCYAAVSGLSLVLLPDRGPALLYILMLGHYPMLKYLVERLKSPVLQWICKLALFNACLSLTFLLFSAFTSGLLPDVPVPLLFLGGSAVFAVYDLGLTKLIAYYTRHIRTKYK